MRVVAIFVAFLLVAADWPQFLGPNRDGSTAEIVKPWKADPKVVWKVPVGEGHSGPVVAGSWVFLFDKAPDRDAERIRAWDRATGTPHPVLDGRTVDHVQPRKKFQSPFGVGPRATPAIVNHPSPQQWKWRVVNFGVTGEFLLSAVNDEGAFTARIDSLIDKYQAPLLKFGMSGSPLIDEDRVIMCVGGRLGHSLLALRLFGGPDGEEPGDVVWNSLDDAVSYASPTIITAAGTKQLAVLTAAAAVGLDPKTGKELWRYPFKDLLSESSATPLLAGDDTLIISSVTLGSVALKIEKTGDRPVPREIWRNKDLNSYFATPVAIGEHLYMVTAGSPLAAIATGQFDVALKCVERSSGKVLWTKPKVGTYHASLIRTGDNKLLMLEEGGDLVLVDANPKEYVELCRTKACGKTWVHPALASGKLYARDAKELKCIGLAE